jgi:hypothetical protein
MNPNPNRNILRRVAFALAAVGGLLLGGCLEQCVVWAPDGQRAAVILDPGLRLCGADGKLTDVLVSDVYAVAWLSDSQQLVLARSHKETAWTPIAKAMGAEAAAAFVARGDAMWQRLQTGMPWEAVKPLFGDGEFNLTCIYLRERYGDAFKAKLSAEDWAHTGKAAAEIHEAVMARRDGDRIVPGTQLYAGLSAVKDIRIAPGDKAVALVLTIPPRNKDNEFRLVVARVHGTGLTPVADHVANFPDWTPDGRSLVYVQAAGPETKDDLRLGTLVQREVLDAKGAIAVSDEPKYLAGWIFSANSRVRCLRDGRILFNAAEISLPIAAEDYGEEREQLFALDPARQATLVRMIPRKREENLPSTLAFFEVSPDEKQVVFGWIEGQVCRLTLATGEVQQIQGKVGQKENLQGAPVWRADGTLTYTRRAKAVEGKEPARPAEVVVRRGDKEAVLSATWPDELVNKLFSRSQE